MSYCHYCGNEVTSGMLYCPSCGAQRQGPSEYCAVCGFAFGGTEELPAPVRRMKAQEPPEEPETYED